MPQNAEARTEVTLRLVQVRTSPLVDSSGKRNRCVGLGGEKKQLKHDGKHLFLGYDFNIFFQAVYSDINSSSPSLIIFFLIHWRMHCFSCCPKQIELEN